MKPAIALLVMSVLVAAAGLTGSASAAPDSLPRVAVLPVKMEVYAWGWNAEASVTPLLESVVSSSGRVVLVERRRLEDVLGEQVLQRMGLVDAQAAARIGGLLGADLLVICTVPEATAEARGRLWTPAGEMEVWQAAVALSVRVVFVRDGRVLLAGRYRGEARNLAFQVSSGSITLGGRSNPEELLDQAAKSATERLRPDLLRVLSEPLR